MPHELAPTLTNPQLDGGAVNLKGKFHTISRTKAVLTGYWAKLTGLGSVKRGGRRQPNLSQIERAMWQTLSGWKEDIEEIDAFILDSPKA
jgi:hypothetical protein